MDLGDLVAVSNGADLTRVLLSYRAGVFPMGIGEDGGEPLGWWSPRARGVLRPGGLRVSKSLRRSAKKYEVRVDTCFAEVVDACADPDRPGAWITPEIFDLYSSLHDSGHAHSVEVFCDEDLIGGLYGIAHRGLFAGESMFHRRPDASKVALVALVDLLDGRKDAEPWLIDSQWLTPHLASLGFEEVSAAAYQRLLHRAKDGSQSELFLSA